MRRRDWIRGVAGLWVSAATTSLMSGCGKPETPLAHLSGRAWVEGAYEYYGATYADLQQNVEDQSSDAYRVLAQKGIDALGMLQKREVPFHARVDPAGAAFQIRRDVPERLTYTANMGEAERRRTKAAWEKARETIHTDYAEIQRLNWALTRLLSQLQRIHHAIEAAQAEQFRLTRQLAEVKTGEVPFELPRDVKSKDYSNVLYMLVDRLQDDRQHLDRQQTQILAIGLVARSTDAGSASLASNLQQVLLAVVRDADASVVRPSAYPRKEDEAAALQRGKALVAQIEQSEGYQAWLRREQTAWLTQIGSFLSLVDAATGIPVSQVYNKAVSVFREGGDYLDYLELVASFSPSPQLNEVLKKCVALSRKVRDGVDTAQALIAKADQIDSSEILGALVNTGTEQARKQVDKQLLFFSDKLELSNVTEELASTSLMQKALPRELDRYTDALSLPPGG
ncbi:MAG: hypothetical protein AAGA56_21095 [Myxococcota bacterium]